MKKVTSGERPAFKTQIPKSYELLITQCWEDDPLNRPSFDQILNQLKEDPGFITNKIDQRDFRSYINYIYKYRNQNNEPVPIIPIKDFINYKSKRFIDIFFIGEPSEIYHQGEIFEKGDGIPVDKPEAARYYKKAAQKGHTDAMFKYGWMLLYGIGVQIDKQKAYFYIKEAADQGNIEAMYNYGWLVSHGDVIPADEALSILNFKMAADKGHIDAMNNYAFRLLKGIGVDIDKENALKYFKNAADKGQVRAMLNYGCCIMEKEQTLIKKKQVYILKKLLIKAILML